MKCLFCGIDNDDVQHWFGVVAFFADDNECHQRWRKQQTGAMRINQEHLQKIRQERNDNTKRTNQ